VPADELGTRGVGGRRPRLGSPPRESPPDPLILEGVVDQSPVTLEELPEHVVPIFLAVVELAKGEGREDRFARGRLEKELEDGVVEGLPALDERPIRVGIPLVDPGDALDGTVEIDVKAEIRSILKGCGHKRVERDILETVPSELEVLDDRVWWMRKCAEPPTSI
jgi:hypothetical protein